MEGTLKVIGEVQSVEYCDRDIYRSPKGTSFGQLNSSCNPGISNLYVAH